MSMTQPKIMKNGNLKWMKTARFCMSIEIIDCQKLAPCCRWSAGQSSPLTFSLRCEASNIYWWARPRPSAHGSQQKALPLCRTVFEVSALHWRSMLHWHLIRSEFSVNSDLLAALSITYDPAFETSLTVGFVWRRALKSSSAGLGKRSIFWGNEMMRTPDNRNIRVHDCCYD